MPQLDRLSSLVQNFEISCTLDHEVNDHNLIIHGTSNLLETLSFMPAGSVHEEFEKYTGEILASARIDVGFSNNPLIEALPAIISIDLKDNIDIAAIAHLIVREAQTPRCGGESVFSRLGELLVIHLLRNSLERNETRPGLLAGLAHPRLSHVIVAIHDKPQRNWCIDDFTDLAGMSRSRFMEEFQNVMTVSPMAYLKQWRMTLAHAALLKGERVSEIARRFGYNGGDAFSRAFSKTYGIAPSQVRARGNL